MSAIEDFKEAIRYPWEPYEVAWIRLYRDTMQNLKATKAVVTFDGQGDSGYSRLIMLLRDGKWWSISDAATADDPKARIMPMPKIQAEMPSQTFSPSGGWIHEMRKNEATLEMIISKFVWTTVDWGWENNEGGFGEITITDNLVVGRTVLRQRYGARKSIHKRPNPTSMRKAHVKIASLVTNDNEELIRQIEREESKG